VVTFSCSNSALIFSFKVLAKFCHSSTMEISCDKYMYILICPVPWRLRHPPFRHCDTPTRTIWHCNDSPHKRFHIETIRPHRGRTVRPHPNRSVQPLRSGSKRWLWQSVPRTIRPILCFARRVRGQFGRRHTDGAVKKQLCATRENFTHAWFSWAQAWPNLTPNMARPTQQNST
jgi:hypothetical protein